MASEVQPVETPAPLRVRVYRGADAAGVLDASWDDVVAHSAIPNPTYSADWLRELLGEAHGVPLAVIVDSGHEVVAAGLFEVRAFAGRRGLRLARTVADGLSLVSQDLPVVRGMRDAPRLVVEALFEEAHAFELQCPAGGDLAQAVATRAPWCRSRPDFPGWATPLPPPKLGHARTRAEYEIRRAERAGAHVAVDVLAEPDHVAKALERLFELHELRWQGRPHALPRFSTTERQRALYRRAVAALARSGRVRIVEVREDDTVVASCLGLLHGRGALFHTTATRTGGRLRSPGHVAMVAWADVAGFAGAEVMALGQSADQPEGPKSRIGSVAVPYALLFAGRSRAAHRLVDRSMRLRRRAQRFRSLVS